MNLLEDLSVDSLKDRKGVVYVEGRHPKDPVRTFNQQLKRKGIDDRVRVKKEKRGKDVISLKTSCPKIALI